MSRLGKPSDQPQAQRERVCKTRYGENAAGKWVRRSAFREVDYAPDDPTKLREFATSLREHYSTRSSAIGAAEHARADTYKVLETVLESIGA